VHRREALAFLGTAVLAPLLAPLSAQQRYVLGQDLHARITGGGAPGQALPAAQMTLVTALSDALLPRTDTPGAVDVEVPKFVDLLVAEWYPDQPRAGILAGLDAIDAKAVTRGGRPFAELDAAAQAGLLTELDRREHPDDPAERTWRSLRDQIVFGYLTSKPIAELVRTTPIIPGRFDGCVPVGGPP
jgi:gluconate 2-dehydrogenase gamma chain